jgi:DNA-directed RNA polymerase subunit M/transcription elongation factor TFIIS
MKVTEKQLKARCTELNLGSLKDTSFGVRVERNGKGYTVSLVYRNSTPPETLIIDATAAEADACVSGVATTSTVYKAIQGTIKPEFVPQEVFVKQHGERCPKCGSRDINPGHIRSAKSELDQWYNCSRCETAWTSCYKLTGYFLPDKVAA